MVDIHVYVIPTEFWRDSLNSVSSDAVIEALSAGFILVDPESPLTEVRHHIYEQLQSEAIPTDFSFLRIVGRCLAKVSEKQELLLKAKSYLPPQTFSPDIYLIDSRVTKRPMPRSTGSNNSDGFSLPRLTPNGNYGGAPDGPDNNFVSPIPIKTLNIADLDQPVVQRSLRNSMPNDTQANQMHRDSKRTSQALRPAEDYGDLGDEIMSANGNNDDNGSSSDQIDPNNVLAVKLELAKRERAEMEVKRKGLLKRLHELQENVQGRRKEAYEYWRSRFTDEKSRTPYLEDQASALGKDIDNLHKKLVRQLGNNNADTSLLTRQLQVLKLRQTVDLLKLKVEEGHTKLMCQIRLRNQAETELRAMRAELTQKKVLVQLLKSKLPNATDLL